MAIYTLWQTFTETLTAEARLALFIGLAITTSIQILTHSCAVFAIGLHFPLLDLRCFLIYI